MYALLGIQVEVVLQTLFYCAHVHRGLDYLIVILGKAQIKQSVLGVYLV